MAPLKASGAGSRGWGRKGVPSQLCRFPVEKLTRNDRFDGISTAFDDSLSGRVAKPLSV